MEKCGALCLFATHYHELGELEGKIDGVVGCCVTGQGAANDDNLLAQIAARRRG